MGKTLSTENRFFFPILIFSAISLALFIATVGIQEYINFHRRNILDWQRFAQNIEVPVRETLLAHSPEDIQKVLNIFQDIPSISYAAVIKNDRVLAKYMRGGSFFPFIPSFTENDCRKEGSQVRVSYGVMVNDQAIGWIYIIADCSIFSSMFPQIVLAGCISFLLMIPCSYIASQKIGRLIYAPLRDFVKTAGRISDTKDYSLCLEGKSKSKEETVLHDSFNKVVTGFDKWAREKKYTLKKLHKSEKRYRLLFETAPVSMWEEDFSKIKVFIEEIKKECISSPRQYIENHPKVVREIIRMMDIRDINRMTLQLYEAESKEHLIYGLGKIFSPKLIDTCKEALIAILEGKRHFERETTSRTITGKVIFILVSIIFPETKSEYSYVVISMTDITKHKKTEEAVRHLNEELEQRVRERTIKLEEANKELKTFTYSVSHDLRAPLRAIEHFTTTILDSSPPSFDQKTKRILDNIIKASSQMNQMINDLLDYSKVSHQKIVFSVLSLNDLFLSIRNLFLEEIVEKKAILNVPEGLPYILGDRTLCLQIFTNLISNALKYHSPNKSAEIKISCQANKGYVTVCVKDRGIGIAEKHHEKILQLFRRLHSQEVYPGTGIGLATVKKAVEMMGGKIYLVSQEGKGAKFYIELQQAEYCLTNSSQLNISADNC